MDQHVIIFNVGIGEKRKRSILTFWNPHSSGMGSNYFTCSIGNDARLARWKYGKVNCSSTLDLCFVLPLQDSQLKSSTNHSGACISWRWRKENPQSKKIGRAWWLLPFAALSTTHLAETKNAYLIELRAQKGKYNYWYEIQLWQAYIF